MMLLGWILLLIPVLIISGLIIYDLGFKEYLMVLLFVLGVLTLAASATAGIMIITGL